MIITKGLGDSRLLTKGYGPNAAPPLSNIDTGYKGASARSVASLTRKRTGKVLTKLTWSNK